jgi:hypothetical protein
VVDPLSCRPGNGVSLSDIGHHFLFVLFFKKNKKFPPFLLFFLIRILSVPTGCHKREMIGNVVGRRWRILPPFSFRTLAAAGDIGRELCVRVCVCGGRAILLIDSIYLWRPVGPTLPISVVKDPG